MARGSSVYSPNAAAIVQALHGRGNRAQCPSCAADGRDKGRNHLAVSERGSVVLVHCFAGCPQSDVIDALRRLGVWPERERPSWTPEQKRQWAQQRARGENLALRVSDWARGQWLNIEAVKRQAFRTGDDRLLEVAARALYRLETATPGELIQRYQADDATERHESTGRADREHVDEVARLVVAIMDAARAVAA